MAQENKCWGYDRIAGALGNLGHVVSHQTIGNILKRHGITPAPKRSQSTSWTDFIAALAGTDFFTVEVLTWRGLVTYYVLFIPLGQNTRPARTVRRRYHVDSACRTIAGTVAGIRDRSGESPTTPPVRIPRAENRILRAHLPGKVRLSDSERRTLADIGKRLGRTLLSEVACVAKPETILVWYRRLIARKFDGSKHRSYPGRPRVSPDVEALVVRMAQENGSWGYDRLAGALANPGHYVSDQPVGNVLKRHGIPTAPKRSQSTAWKDFISAHMAVLAGTDFFTVEVLTWRGLATYYVLFFLNL